MPSGDTLTVIGLAITAMIGALTVSGGRAIFLWALGGFFALLAFGYAGAFQRIGVDASDLAGWGVALIAPVTVLVVALMLRSPKKVVASEDAPAAQPSPAVDPKRTALLQINLAIKKADWSGMNVPDDAVREAQPVLYSAFATVRKVYGIETPDLGEPSQYSLAHGVAFLRAIKPFLSAGHIDEARQAAKDFKFP